MSNRFFLVEFFFKCSKCAKCCTNLMMNGHNTGLTLFKEETYLFPDNCVIPGLAVGESTSPDFTVLTYQYIGDSCIHLDNNRCMIHESRPQVCRSYPFRFSVKGRENPYYSVAPECTVIEESGILESGNASITENNEMVAAREIGYRLISFYETPQKGEKIWRYNQMKNAWE
jgi:Fe-S-cluster containining protein